MDKTIESLEKFYEVTGFTQEETQCIARVALLPVILPYSFVDINNDLEKISPRKVQDMIKVLKDNFLIQDLENKDNELGLNESSNSFLVPQIRYLMLSLFPIEQYESHAQTLLFNTETALSNISNFKGIQALMRYLTALKASIMRSRANEIKTDLTLVEVVHHLEERILQMNLNGDDRMFLGVDSAELLRDLLSSQSIS